MKAYYEYEDGTFWATIHNKKVGEFIHAYRTLLLEFNSCIILYNQLNKDRELKPLASVDVSPLFLK